MDASRLDNEITLQHREMTRNAQGEQITTFKTYARVWAEKRDTRGMKRFTAREFFEEQLCEFTLRWRPDVLLTDRLTVLDSGAVYEITQVAEIPRHVGLDLLTRTIPA